MNVLVILGVLFLALFIIIPLVEKSGLRVSSETSSKLSRIILPLVAIMIIIQIFMYVF
ncbi:hypothetical protein [Glaciecola sp. SC05]|uniref:hypothetical protein n=1 Tax=Glaciecola sp. SC05 TaxID=1987355 RepID=UPI00352997DB